MAASRSLPSHPDLDQQKTLAKELLRAFRQGDADAIARVRAELPDRDEVRLADAQFVVAREYGFVSWAEMRRHIARIREHTTPPVEAVRAALYAGNARAVRDLLRRHAELRALINEPVFSYDSPALVHFSGSGNVELIDVLLEFGADPNRRSDWWAGGFHALYGASPAVAERLIAAGAVIDACAAAHLDRIELLQHLIEEDPARVHERGGDGQTPLHFARSRAVVDLLLGAGADADARDIDHRATPAQWMLQKSRGRGRYDLAAYLVERGATPDIFLAAALGLADRVREMLRSDPSLLDLRTTQGEYGEKPPSSYHIYMWTIGADLSPIQVAQQFGQTETLEVMRAIASPRQLLVTLLSSGDRDGTDSLLREYPDLLESLAATDQRLLPEAAWSANARAVQLMLDLGFDPAARDARGATALHCAAWEGAVDCVSILLRHPGTLATLNDREPTYGATPLGWCCHGSCHGPARDHASVARMLLEAGAVPEERLRDVSDAVRAVIEEWRRAR